MSSLDHQNVHEYVRVPIRLDFAKNCEELAWETTHAAARDHQRHNPTNADW